MTVRELIAELEKIEEQDAEVRFEDMNNFTNYEFEFIGIFNDGNGAPIFRIYVELGY